MRRYPDDERYVSFERLFPNQTYLACPFCRSQAIYMSVTSKSPAAACMTCGAEGPMVSMHDKADAEVKRKKAFDLWNDR